MNVNSRYTVEGVLITGDGWTTDVVSDRGDKLNNGLRRELMGLIGEKLNPSVLDDLAKRLRKEFHARAVTHRVLRGASPDYVRVVFEMQVRPTRFDVSVPKFLYHAKQGWSGEVDGTVSVKQNGFTFGLVSDGDELVERYAGLTARYENTRLATDRLKLRFEFDSYHTQWNRSTLEELRPVHAGYTAEFSGVYRTRQSFEPTLRIVLAKPLTLTVGTGFQRFQSQFPDSRTETANAVLAGLHFRQKLEGDNLRQDFDGRYDLRAATRVFNTDFVYARHRLSFRYTLNHGRHTIMDEAMGGVIGGRAPLLERFVLGNNSTLRGWNKWELDPLGGNRVVHNSVEYRYGVFQVFYDAGAIWDNGQNAVARQSVGAGLRYGAFSLAVAFPLREGRVEPVFMVGMNY
jgi:hypothetical protein